MDFLAHFRSRNVYFYIRLRFKSCCTLYFSKFLGWHLVFVISFSAEANVLKFHRLGSLFYGIKQIDNLMDVIEGFVHGYSLPWELQAISGLSFLLNLIDTKPCKIQTARAENCSSFWANLPRYKSNLLFPTASAIYVIIRGPVKALPKPIKSCPETSHPYP